MNKKTLFSNSKGLAQASRLLAEFGKKWLHFFTPKSAYIPHRVCSQILVQKNFSLFRLGSHNQSRCLGFTLIELLISVAVTGIIIFAATLVYTMSLRSIDLQLVNVEVHREARLVLNLIKKDLTDAQNSTVAISTVPFGIWNKIEFTKIDDRNISYYQNGDKITRTVGTSSLDICPAGLVSLVFYRPDPAGAPKVYGAKVTLRKTSRFSSKFSLEYTAKIDSIEVMN